MNSGPENSRQRTGAIGEAAVRAHVQSLGWEIVDHNVRWREGELDLIAVDGATLVVAEVKTLVGRAADGSPAFSPFESIGARKQDQIRSLTRRWISDDVRRIRGSVNTRFTGLRFDAFAVILDRDGAVTSIEHLEDAF